MEASNTCNVEAIKAPEILEKAKEQKQVVQFWNCCIVEWVDPHIKWCFCFLRKLPKHDIVGLEKIEALQAPKKGEANGTKQNTLKEAQEHIFETVAFLNELIEV